MSLVILNDLDHYHKLRNTPLGELNAIYKWKKASEGSPWRTVIQGAPKLIPYTFNQLGSSWTDSDWWAVDVM